jgi:maltose alpha-D-glucosyltransferase/alpha-amylase
MAAASLVKLAGSPVPQEVAETIGTYLENARQLGERTADMHLALATDNENPNFAPEPFTPHHQRGLFQSMRNMARQIIPLLNQRLKSLPEEIQPIAQEVAKMETEILRRFRVICERRLDVAAIRHHGDYRLGQVIHTGKDFLIIDFEGESALSLGERRLKKSPLIDVAGMIRSFHNAAYIALWRQLEHGPLPGSYAAGAAVWAKFWARWVSAAFLGGYLRRAASAAFIPTRPDDLEMLMDVFLLRRAVYEVGYDLRSRPGRVKLSLQGLSDILGGGISALPNRPDASANQREPANPP